MLSKKLGLKVASLLTAGVMSLSSAAMLKVCAVEGANQKATQSNSGESFWSKYKNYVIGGTSAVGVAAVAVLSVLYLKKHKANVANNADEQLLNNENPKPEEAQHQQDAQNQADAQNQK